MFKSNNKSIAQQLRSKFSFSSPSSAKGEMKSSKQHGERKIPRIPTPEEEDSMQQSIKERMTPNNNEYINAYGAFFLEYSIAAEFNHLKKTRIPGVYVIPSFYNPLVWFGVIFIRQGIYQDGVFRFTLTIPNNYPDGDSPAVAFTPPVFHPFINATTGHLDLDRAFGTWRYENDPEAYKQKVQDVISELNNRIYEDTDTEDPHAFRFREWNENTHGEVRKKLHAPKADKDPPGDGFDKPKLSGLSFVEPATSLIFSKER